MRPVALEQKALGMWRDREMSFPRFTRRMTPDGMDMASGAWALMLAAASATADSPGNACEGAPDVDTALGGQK